jgi:hypothetical protein
VAEIVAAMKNAGLIAPSTWYLDCAIASWIRAASRRAERPLELFDLVHALGRAWSGIDQAVDDLIALCDNAEYRVHHTRARQRAALFESRIKALANDLTVTRNQWYRESVEKRKRPCDILQRQFSRRVS